jgi:glycerate kinase
MAQALGARLLDANGRELGRGGAELARLERIDMSRFDARVRAGRVTGATDVRNPLCGPDGASIVYGPQKGATPQTARELDTALRRYAGVIDRDLGVGVLNVPGAGSAGGLGAGLVAFLGAEILPGIEVVGNAVRLQESVREADLVITGEGRLDAQTGYGKTVAGVAEAARAAGVPVIIVAGSLGDGWENAVPDEAVVEAADAARDMTPRQALAHATERAVRRWRR